MFKKRISIILCLVLALQNVNTVLAAEMNQVENVSEIESAEEIETEDVEKDETEEETVIEDTEEDEAVAEDTEDMDKAGGEDSGEVEAETESEMESVSETVDDKARESKNVSVKYQTHIQNVGWQQMMQNGEKSGTTGKALRLEGIRIHTEGNEQLGIAYQTHIQNIGWQDWRSDGKDSGTSGKSLRLEAIRIKLTGDEAANYSVCYRVHAENFGWLGWAKNGEAAGTEGFGYRLEAIEIKILKNGENPGNTNQAAFKKKPIINYRAHVQNVGWQNYVRDGALAGTSGRGLRLEAIQINIKDQDVAGDIEYRTHVQNIGWQDYVKNDQLSGTSGKSLRLEAIQIKLTGEMAKRYDVYYRTHVQNFGWLGWAKNGQASGSEGYGYRMESMQIRLLPKGSAAPGSTENCYRKFDKAHIFNEIKRHTFVPYVYGGTTTKGWDCSGFTRWAMAKLGVTVPRSSVLQSKVGSKVNILNMKEWRPGDLIFFAHKQSKIVGHVALYLGDGMMMHASNPKRGTYIISVDKYNKMEKNLFMSQVNRYF